MSTTSRAGAGGRSADTRLGLRPRPRRAGASGSGPRRLREDRPRPPGSTSRDRRGTSDASPPRWSMRRRPPRRLPQRSARSAAAAGTPRSRSLPPFFDVLADDVEQPLPALALVVDPLGGLGERLRA